MELKQREEFTLEAKNFFEQYKSQIIGQSFRENGSIVNLSFESLLKFSPALSDSLLEKPEETLAILEDAMAEMDIVKKPRIRLTTLPVTENVHLKIRNIRAEHLDQL